MKKNIHNTYELASACIVLCGMIWINTCMQQVSPITISFAISNKFSRFENHSWNLNLHLKSRNPFYISNPHFKSRMNLNPFSQDRSFGHKPFKSEINHMAAKKGSKISKHKKNPSKMIKCVPLIIILTVLWSSRIIILERYTNFDKSCTICHQQPIAGFNSWTSSLLK